MKILNKEEICEMLPHSGSMCLLNEVRFWDGSQIRCHSLSQCQDDNPLLHNRKLPAISAVEYAAQAMGVHRALIYQEESTPEVGYLAAIKNVSLYTDFLEHEKELLISCTCINGDSNGFIYAFEINNSVNKLIEGRATVIIPTSNRTG